jgi:hypothetical protein
MKISSRTHCFLFFFILKHDLHEKIFYIYKKLFIQQKSLLKKIKNSNKTHGIKTKKKLSQLY